MDDAVVKPHFDYNDAVYFFVQGRYNRYIRMDDYKHVLRNIPYKRIKLLNNKFVE